MVSDETNAREIMSRAFAKSEFNPDLDDHMFAGERADEGDRLADVALAALRAAGYGVVRLQTPEEPDEDMTPEEFDRRMAQGTPVTVAVNLARIRPPAAGPDYPL